MISTNRAELKLSSLRPIALAALAGGAAGVAAYGATRLSRLALIATVGALIGGCVPVLSRRFRGALRVSEIKLSVPQWSELTFVVDNEARLVAWRLYVEVSTRVSTQALDSDEGVIREALSSLYSLFTTTREALKATRPTVQPGVDGHSVEHAAILMLNGVIRPFLSRWHLRLARFEEANPGVPDAEWPEIAQCRAELAQVSRDVLEYVEVFAKLAGVRNPGQILGIGRPPDRAGPARPDVSSSPAMPRHTQ